MQNDKRGTVASLTPQIGSPRPFSTWDLQGSAWMTARHADDGGRGATLQISSHWMVLASRFGASGRPLLHALIIFLLSSYHPLIILLHGVI